ncbi:hypothetical protein BDP27DRAFT_950849 [Rhodocollybia butyracea]|uniref:Uncharacterized protein n=1 Tax=Rhodocollybia butyracea TaxID=206335 RepID=A0A9P5UDZ3_9AGAR|nr:hypothetical protein BDP27DRAFT_950849 [Rhodocollybia butyracea]
MLVADPLRFMRGDMAQIASKAGLNARMLWRRTIREFLPRVTNNRLTGYCLCESKTLGRSKAYDSKRDVASFFTERSLYGSLGIVFLVIAPCTLAASECDVIAASPFKASSFEGVESDEPLRTMKWWVTHGRARVRVFGVNVTCARDAREPLLFNSD